MPVIKKKKVARKLKAEKKEMTILGGALRALGGMAGGAAGSMFGAPTVGAGLGTGLGAALSRWLGSGDYTLNKNSLMAGNRIPMMHKTSQSITVRHKEFVCDVYGSTSFNVNASFPLNPGLEASFPWLSSIAQQFQEYSWKGIVFHYVPTSGDSVASTNTALGSVILATNYRSTLPPYQNKLQMLNEYCSSDSKPSECFVHPIECDPKENPFNVQYVRSGTVPTGEDQKMYDLGVTSLAVVGNPASGAVLGELWCTYEVELRKPIPLGLTDAGAQYAHYTISSPMNTSPLGVSALFVDSFPLVVSGGSITLPRGFFGTVMVVIWYRGATSMGVMTYTTVNCTQNGAIFTGSNTGIYQSFASIVTETGGPAMIAYFNKPDITTTATITPVVSPLTGVTLGDLIVCQINSTNG
jgi:hypothetical protein